MFELHSERYLGGQTTILGMARQPMDMNMACIVNVFCSLCCLLTSFSTHPVTLLPILTLVLLVISQTSSRARIPYLCRDKILHLFDIVHLMLRGFARDMCII